MRTPTLLTRGMIGRLLRRHASSLHDLRYMAYLFRRSPLAILGLVLILLVAFVAIFAPQLATEHPRVTLSGDTRWPLDFSSRLLPPSGEHWLGTTHNGNDLLSMILYGARVSLRIGFTVVASAVAIGVVLGSIAGYFGRRIDELIMRVTDVFLSIPSFVLALAVVAALGQSLDNVMYALVITWWPIYARIIRGQVLSVRENQYIDAARSVGAGPLRIIAKHVLPNTWAPVLVQATLDFGNTILVAAGLSFIGLGAPPGTAEWGLLVSQGRQVFPVSWWYVTFPGLAILVTVLGFNLFGDGLRDIMDPKLRR